MKKLTKEELEAIEVCQHDEKGNCEDCPAKYCDCFRDPVTTALLLMEELRVMKNDTKD
jgi:hypothetical protein